MGYLYLSLSVFAGVTKAFCSKKQSSKAGTLPSAMLTSLVRMLICIPIGVLFFIISNSNLSALTDVNTILIALLSAAATSVYVIAWLFSVRKGAFMLSTVFVMLGVVVTVGLSGIFFNETVTLKQIIGLAVLVLASLVMCSYSADIKGKLTFSAIILLVLCGILNGLMDFSQKLFVYSVSDGSIEAFNFYTYLFSSAILGVVYIFLNKEKLSGSENPKAVLKSVLPYITVMGIATFLGSYFKTLSATYLPAPVLYPLFQGLTLPLMSLSTAVFFGEKITLKSAIGIALAFVSMLLINM